ncbi:gliding motility-associated C-terminal domain-containing protein [Chitinophaga horti]|uniref:Gliding motility-associated C-terminal domain-containing protein n=1 Tax=Chitinophaga horti TaxID=2920382 RepID=A0ABY6J9P8_9BACT|nr:gliding motility-associated C-terminal domain-containing protein [Chitinophaga horti]UYQ94899.1 gliding motility-associated C-terminal domain-containing protein [Chitinophaga horti]
MTYPLSYPGVCRRAFSLCRRHALYLMLTLPALSLRAGGVTPTDIQLPVKEIHENNLTGTAVGAFMSNDAAASSYAYTLVAGADDVDNAAFTIDSKGVLRANVVFDYETKSSYSIRVRATNNLGEFLERTFSIHIADVYETPEKLDANNILTPNGDGINDLWVVKNLDPGKNNTLAIYDRIGRMVYTKKNYQNDWNGSVNGSHLAEGTYYYVLDLGPKQFKGYITLVRDKR